MNNETTIDPTSVGESGGKNEITGPQFKHVPLYTTVNTQMDWIDGSPSVQCAPLTLGFIKSK